VISLRRLPEANILGYRNAHMTQRIYRLLIALFTRPSTNEAATLNIRLAPDRSVTVIHQELFIMRLQDFELERIEQQEEDLPHVRLGTCSGLAVRAESEQVTQELLIGGENLLRRFEDFVRAVTVKTMEEAQCQTEVSKSQPSTCSDLIGDLSSGRWWHFFAKRFLKARSS